MPSTQSTSRESIPADIDAIEMQLRRIYAAAVAVQLALRHQAAEQDFELSEALRCGVCNALGDQISELERLGTLARRQGRR